VARTPIGCYIEMYVISQFGYYNRRFSSKILTLELDPVQARLARNGLCPCSKDWTAAVPSYVLRKYCTSVSTVQYSSSSVPVHTFLRSVAALQRTGEKPPGKLGNTGQRRMGVLEEGNYFKKCRHYSVILLLLGCDAHSTARLLGKP